VVLLGDVCQVEVAGERSHGANYVPEFRFIEFLEELIPKFWIWRLSEGASRRTNVLNQFVKIFAPECAQSFAKHVPHASNIRTKISVFAVELSYLLGAQTASSGMLMKFAS
jgi:hypothetical protein